MAKRKDKIADKVKHMYTLVKNHNRAQWEYINQKGFDFAHDNQLTEKERIALEEQGMPTFTINRIMPVVEMLNFYATANKPRWQAIGVEGSDSDVAAVFSDIADYVWDLSNGSGLYANCINDAVTKSVGYLMVTVDQNSDEGMGDVIIKQPEPFDVFVDPKSRDMLFKDAAFVMIRKVLPKVHLQQLFPEMKAKIKRANSSYDTEDNYSEKSMGPMQKDFGYKDIDSQEAVDPDKGERDELIEFFEVYEKIKVPYVNVFYVKPPDEKQMKQIQQQVEVAIKEMEQELQVELAEKERMLGEALQSGQIIQERYELELTKAQKEMESKIQEAYMQLSSKLQAESSIIENISVTEKEFIALSKEPDFAKHIQDSVKFYKNRVRQCCVAGDVTLYEKVLPDNITEYPIVPFHFKWTGTPYPISAVSPLIGKQREINKAHQLMVHNASLGSSLRWMHEEGSIDPDYWEKYASSPGALLPVRSGATPPTPVQPAPLSNAFFSICQEGKQDMEYLAGIYSAMMGDAGAQHETYRGMLAVDEYGTRRIKQWMTNALEPALKQLGTSVMQFTQAIYSANKRFNIVQPDALQGEKQVEINIPIFNDMGEAIQKSMDYQEAKFDVRIIAGSTMPINRWAYLEELKQLLQFGVVDDIAVLAETDLKNKEQIIQRKSLYSQLQGQIQQMEASLQDKEGTIETLSRQLVQAGIKTEVLKASKEVDKRKEQLKGDLQREYLDTEAEQKLLKGQEKNNSKLQQDRLKNAVDQTIKDLQTMNKK
tara:strand:- start:2371 stop:4671 length:2301 start_codon:yes stop_codon:yes gene_type:complete